MKIVRTPQSWCVTRRGGCGGVELDQLARRFGYRVGEICMELGCCEGHLHAMFIRDIGLAPKEWLRQERMVVARRLLHGGIPPEEVAEDLGFSCLNAFRREFRGVYGVSPLRFQRDFLRRMVLADLGWV